MNLILVERAELDEGGRVSVRGRRAHHICKVLRPQVGEFLRVGLVRGGLGRARVLALSEHEVQLEPDWQKPATPRPAVDLVLAMPRPKALARVLQTCACLGVGRIDLVNAWRVDKSYLASSQLQPDCVRRNLLLGCEQAASTWVPDVEVHRLLMPFMRGLLAERIAAGQRGLLAHPESEALIEDEVRQGQSRRVVVAVGPEGGWIERELASFTEAGFARIALGHPIMRVEIAVTAVLAQLGLLRRL